MIRWSHVVIASLGMTGLALAQPPSSQPPPPAAGPVGTPAAAPAPAAPEAPAPAPQSKLGADLAVVLPMGDYADGVDAAFGLFGRLEVGLSPQLFATGRLGFLYHLLDGALQDDLDISLTMIPIYGGIRYNIEPTGNGIFVLGEAGINILRTSVSFMGSDASSSTNTNLSFNVGGGFQAGALSFRGTVFFTADVSEASDIESENLYGLMVALGYDFIAL